MLPDCLLECVCRSHRATSRARLLNLNWLEDLVRRPGTNKLYKCSNHTARNHTNAELSALKCAQVASSRLRVQGFIMQFGMYCGMHWRMRCRMHR